MERVTSPTGATVSFTREGSGPPLVLSHGAFSDHDTNWEFVAPALREHFTLYSVARRGRGATDRTTGHSLEDEAIDLAAVIRAIGQPVFLVGHSYGAVCSLEATAIVPERIRRLVLYEPGRPDVVTPEEFGRLERAAAAGAWEVFALMFFADTLRVPIADLEALRATALWPPIVTDAEASLHDLRALERFVFRPERYSRIDIPVLLQIGTESPRDLFLTDTLAGVLPRVQIHALKGQAHEGMTTAPELYVDSILAFLGQETEEARQASAA